MLLHPKAIFKKKKPTEMDRRLVEAAQIGNVVSLHKLIKDEPLILRAVSLHGGENPLHIACMAGHLAFVKELLILRVEFATELNPDGFSPLHIASATGEVEIVRAIVEVDDNLCLVEGKESRIPLHYATLKGRVVVIQELLSASADSVEATTSRGETALHLAVKNNQFGAFEILAEHLKRFNKEDVLSKKDEQGNTILHLAVSRKQHEVVDYLLDKHNFTDGAVEVNSLNERNLTPLDVLLFFQSEAGDREIEDILRRAGALKAIELHHSPPVGVSPNPAALVIPNHSTDHVQSETQQFDESQNFHWLAFFRYNKNRDSPGEVRNCLLVIAALIATATYQAVLSPPGGVWQDNSGSDTTKPHIAGQPVMGSYNSGLYAFFLYMNSLGFFYSLHMIQVLTAEFPMQLELNSSMGAIVITYDIAIATFAPRSPVAIFFLVMSIMAPFFIPITMMFLRFFWKAIRGELVFNVDEIV